MCRRRRRERRERVGRAGRDPRAGRARSGAAAPTRPRPRRERSSRAVYRPPMTIAARRSSSGRRPSLRRTVRSGDAAPETQKSWLRPIFPKGCPLSIFGAGELDFRVRDGNGYGLSASVTRIRCVWMLFGCNHREPEGRHGSPPAPAGGSRLLAVDLRCLSQDVDRSTIPSH